MFVNTLALVLVYMRVAINATDHYVGCISERDIDVCGHPGSGTGLHKSGHQCYYSVGCMSERDIDVCGHTGSGTGLYIKVAINAIVM